MVLQWIPGHCSIHGNEQADTLVKKGALLLLTFPKQITFHSVQSIKNDHYNTQHLKYLISNTADNPWRETFLDIPAYPRKTAVALFHLTTGHDLLATHLYLSWDNADTILRTM